MLRFFRKMRQALIPENRFGRYFFYAVGEIVLVVIGILIALQVNNWNEERKKLSDQTRVLRDLRKEFAENQKNLEKVRNNHYLTAAYSKELSELIGIEENEVKPEKFDSLIWAIIRLKEYKPADGVLNSIITSGQLSIINNSELKYLISAWPGIINTYSYHFKINYDYFMNHIYSFLSKNYQMKNLEIKMSLGSVARSNFSIDQKSILSNPEFENHVEMKRINANQLLSTADELYEFQDQILDLVDEELNK